MCIKGSWGGGGKDGGEEMGRAVSSAGRIWMKRTSSGTEAVYPGSRKKGTTSLLFWFVDLIFVSAFL